MVRPTRSLSHFLADLVAHGPCFCCGSFTDLMPDAAGRLLVRCPCCGAEISVGETVCVPVDARVLQAA
jgi:hypothetical protein